MSFASESVSKSKSKQQPAGAIESVREYKGGSFPNPLMPLLGVPCGLLPFLILKYGLLPKFVEDMAFNAVTPADRLAVVVAMLPPGKCKIFALFFLRCIVTNNLDFYIIEMICNDN
jgi:hypothetical protein